MVSSFIHSLSLACVHTYTHSQTRIFDDIVQERDILATQLIRRNEELAVLYEKIRIQQSTLIKGEAQYEGKLDEVAMIREDTKQLEKLLEIRSHEGTSCVVCMCGVLSCTTLYHTILAPFILARICYIHHSSY
jgi:hypothetical protein